MAEATIPNKNFYWGHEHIISLLDVLIMLKAYYILDSSTTSNSALYMKVVEKLKEYNGIEVSETQTRNKFKSLKREFRVNKRKADTSGPGAVTWPYYDKFIELEGNRPSNGTNDLEGETAFEEPSETTLDSEEHVDGQEWAELNYRGRKRKLPGNLPIKEELLLISRVESLDRIDDLEIVISEAISNLSETNADLSEAMDASSPTISSQLRTKLFKVALELTETKANLDFTGKHITLNSTSVAATTVMLSNMTGRLTQTGSYLHESMISLIEIEGIQFTQSDVMNSLRNAAGHMFRTSCNLSNVITKINKDKEETR